MAPAARLSSWASAPSSASEAVAMQIPSVLPSPGSTLHNLGEDELGAAILVPKLHLGTGLLEPTPLANPAPSNGVAQTRAFPNRVWERGYQGRNKLGASTLPDPSFPSCTWERPQSEKLNFAPCLPSAKVAVTTVEATKLRGQVRSQVQLGNEGAVNRFGGPDNLLSGCATRTGSDHLPLGSRLFKAQPPRFLWPAATRTTSCPGHRAYLLKQATTGELS